MIDCGRTIRVMNKGGIMRWKIAIVLMSVFALAATAVAVEVYPGPPDMGITWARGENGTTYQHWDFPDGDLPAYPDPLMMDNEYGEPKVEFVEGAWEWQPLWPCPESMNPGGGVSGWHCTSPNGGKIKITIPNNNNESFQKLIFMQLTGSKSPSDVSVSGTGSASGYTDGIWPPGTTPPQQGWGSPVPFPPGNWYTYFYGFYIVPNPEEETITIEVAYCTVIDQIVIDTLCTEEPFPNELFSWGWIKSTYAR